MKRLGKRVIADLDPVSLTQPDHKTNAIDLLRDYARGVPVHGQPNTSFGNDDTTMDRASLERLKVEAKDLVQVVKAETEKAKNDQNKKAKLQQQQQRQKPTQPPTSPTTGASEQSSQKQPATPKGT